MLPTVFVVTNKWSEADSATLSTTPPPKDHGGCEWHGYATQADAERVIADLVERDNRKAPTHVRVIGGYRVGVVTDPAPRRNNNHGVRWRIYVGGRLEGRGESAHEQAAREHAWEAAEQLIARRGTKAHA